MHIHIKPVLLIAGCGMLCFAACKKYADPPPAGHDPRLTNHYCNDPRAVNYNWGFPGIPDNSVCVFPVDSFIGSWQVTDSVFRIDSTFDTVEYRTLSFVATEDTALIHLAVHGWCAGNTLYATADRYGLAALDSIPATVAGQLLCAQTDTISGYFNLNAMYHDTMQLQMNINDASGAHIHKGWAVRQ